jgi:hypothetical protein
MKLRLDRIDRYWLLFFLSPEYDTVIECLPSCQGPENPAKYPPVTAAFKPR